MPKLNIVVLNYSGGTVTIHQDVKLRKARKGEDESDVVEEYLQNETDHRLSDICYMSSSKPFDIIYE